MWSWLTKIIGLLPGLGSLFSSSAEAEKLKAQAELEEARAFRDGRVAPRYVKGYVASGIALMFALLVIADSIWPELIDLPSLDDIAKTLRTLFETAGGQ